MYKHFSIKASERIEYAEVSLTRKVLKDKFSCFENDRHSYVLVDYFIDNASTIYAAYKIDNLHTIGIIIHVIWYFGIDFGFYPETDATGRSVSHFIHWYFCPQKILDKLDRPLNENAECWRNRCLRLIEDNLLLQSLPYGTKIHVLQGYDFCEDDTVTIIEKNGKPYYQSNRISHLGRKDILEYGFEVLK